MLKGFFYDMSCLYLLVHCSGKVFECGFLGRGKGASRYFIYIIITGVILYKVGWSGSVLSNIIFYLIGAFSLFDMGVAWFKKDFLTAVVQVVRVMTCVIMWFLLVR